MWYWTLIMDGSGPLKEHGSRCGLMRIDVRIVKPTSMDGNEDHSH